MLMLTMVQRDTLIHYLLDELHTYEEDYSDALAPISRKASESHAGEATEMAPLSTAEGRKLFTHMEMSIKRELAIQQTATFVQPSFQSYNPNLHHHSPSFLHYPATPSHAMPYSSMSTFSASSVTTIPSMIGPSQVMYNQTAPSTKTFLPGLAHIPAVPKIPRSIDAWKQVVHDWDKADPSRNHHYALKDWKQEWPKATKQAVLYSNRKTIALEFIDQCVEFFYSIITESEHPILDLTETKWHS